MLIAVTGDTHGRIDAIKNELKGKKPDYLLHTGDLYPDGIKLAEYLGIDFKGVRGNCDTGKRGKREQILDLAGHSFCILHGHKHRVKHTLNNVYYYGREIGAEVVVFGHTHIPCCEFHDGIWLINPGSPSLPRSGSMASYVLIKAELDILLPDIITFGL